MRSFRDVSIKTKVTVLLIGLVSLVLLLVGAGFVINDVRVMKASMTDRLSVLAEVLGANSAVALNFESPADAETVLSSLRHEPAAVFARIYDANGKVFATYATGADTPDLPPPAQDGHRFTDQGYLDVFQRINQENKAIGTV